MNLRLYRRIAQWQSASKYTEEVAAFESCSAYQNARPHILFLSHCVPNPPDKGEKIRAYYELQALCEQYQMHLVCFARSEREMADARALSEACASVHSELFTSSKALLTAGIKFTLGACLNKEYYNSGRLQQYVLELARRVPLQAAFVYTAVMSPYVPEGIPHLLDMVDVDSEKWFEYGRIRRPGTAYKLEGHRMQRFEAACANKSKATIVTTENEAALLRRIVPDAAIGAIENGVDSQYFDGGFRSLPDYNQRRFVVFVGTMDYHPNVDGVSRFADEVFPELRRRIPNLEFVIVGRNPTRRVKQLGHRQGIHITGAVSDVRPYLSQACAVVAPLALARGIQNKVLEALVMGRRVFASEAVCRTFGSYLPRGIVECASTERFVEQIEHAAREIPMCDAAIREAAVGRFSWPRNMRHIADEMGRLCMQKENSPSVAVTR
jgi:polysaccharide biosynthesis protein PslH